ncbi:MAG: hypothetical protein IPQ28_12235 [Sphingobacteriales bacterium]|nr:hypothetical protein [Sphingobacteriales bacterium]
MTKLQSVLQSLQHNPNSARHIVTAGTPPMYPNGLATVPLALLFRFYVQNGQFRANCTNAAPTFFGVPFNIASYALLTHLVDKYAQPSGRRVYTYAYDAHLY